MQTSHNYAAAVFHVRVCKYVENYVENVEKFSHNARDIGVFAVENSLFGMCKTVFPKKCCFDLILFFSYDIIKR